MKNSKNGDKVFKQYNIIFQNTNPSTTIVFYWKTKESIHKQ
jgi:hypothetical protein